MMAKTRGIIISCPIYRIKKKREIPMNIWAILRYTGNFTEALSMKGILRDENTLS